MIQQLRIQELKIQRNYLQHQLLDNFSSQITAGQELGLEQVQLQTQLAAVNAELNSLQGTERGEKLNLTI